MPTLVTVPATTGPKSHETGPEVLLMELPVCPEAVCVRLRAKTIASKPSQGMEVRRAINFFSVFDLESVVGEWREGSVDMVSPEE